MIRKGLSKWIEIDLGAISANLRWVRGRLAPHVALMAVVKADAYGHGAPEVARAALAAGADCLGVLTLEEAARLRAAGVRGRIVALAPPLPSGAGEAVRLRVEPTVDSLALARALARAAGRAPVRVHLDADFGLGRWGVKPSELPALLARAARLPGLRVAGLSAHLDYVPGRNAVEAEEKLRLFHRLAEEAKQRLPELARHCANSSILLDFPHWHLDMVRVGNLLYGINRTSREAALRGPWALKARIIALKTVRKGAAIGYGSEYLAPRRMTVAALPVGYADGLTMEPAERLIGLGREFRYWGMLRGRKTPFVGRCGIAHVLVDCSEVPGARVGDAVTLPIRRTAASALLPRVYL